MDAEYKAFVDKVYSQGGDAWTHLDMVANGIDLAADDIYNQNWSKAHSHLAYASQKLDEAKIDLFKGGTSDQGKEVTRKEEAQENHKEYLSFYSDEGPPRQVGR